MAISKPGTGVQNEPPSPSNRLLAPPSLSLRRHSSNSKGFVGWPSRGSALRYALGCSVHGVKGTGQRKKCRCNQASRPARHSQRAGNRLNIKNKPGQHKDVKDSQEDAVSLGILKTPLAFPQDQGKLPGVVCEAMPRLQCLPNLRCKAPCRKNPGDWGRWPVPESW